MPNDKGKGTGEPGWTEQEKGQGAPGAGDAGMAGEPVAKAGYGQDGRGATEAAAADQAAEAANKPKATGHGDGAPATGKDPKAS
jgi:hypothetical protein